MSHNYSKKQNPILEGAIGKEMLIFFFPILMGSLFQQIYNTADAMIVGRYLGKLALSAVGGSSGMIVMVVVNFFVGLSSGATVLAAQFFGAKDDQRIVKTVHTAMMFAVLCGAFVMIVGILTAPLMLQLMKAPADTMSHSLLYLRVYFAGMIGNLIYNVGSGLLRAVGDSKRPFIFLVVTCILNVILDLLFILIFHWGIFGAAFATIVSQAVSALLVIIVMIRAKASYRLQFSKLKIDAKILRSMITIGLPAGLQTIMYGLSNIIIQVGVNGLGTDYVAAWATYYKLDVIFWTTVTAFAITGSTFVGQNYGAGLNQRVKKSVTVNLLQAMAASLLITVLVYATAGIVFPLFSTDASVNTIGVAMVRYLSRFYMLYVSIEILSGVLRGVGDTFVPMVLSGIGVCVLRSAWILVVMPKYNNMYTMMNSYPISWIITSIAFYIYLFKFSKLKTIMRLK